MGNLPFVEEILADLRRFKECVEDNQDVNLERSRFDLLTQVGLLERVQRSPARWMMTQAGEDAIAQPAGEPVVWQFEEYVYASGIGHVWTEKLEREKPNQDRSIRSLVPLSPPAAVRGADHE